MRIGFKIEIECLESKLIYTPQQPAAQFTPFIPKMNTYQHKGVLNYTPTVIDWKCSTLDWKSPTILNNNLSAGTSIDIKIEEIQDFTPTPNAAIKCHCCYQDVFKNEFTFHLFFGALQCNNCHHKVLECKIFKNDCFISSNCTHQNLSWSENPMKCLQSQPPEIYKFNYEKVYRYFQCLKSLEELHPWKSVFREYRIFKRDYVNSKEEKNINIDTNIVNEYVEVTKPNVIKVTNKEIFPRDSEKEILDIPADKYYFKTYTFIEECPMCYRKLSLKNCRVDIKQVFLTFWCQCGLKIFYLPKNFID